MVNDVLVNGSMVFPHYHEPTLTCIDTVLCDVWMCLYDRWFTFWWNVATRLKVPPMFEANYFAHTCTSVAVLNCHFEAVIVPDILVCPSLYHRPVSVDAHSKWTHNFFLFISTYCKHIVVLWESWSVCANRSNSFSTEAFLSGNLKCSQVQRPFWYQSWATLLVEVHTYFLST